MDKKDFNEIKRELLVLAYFKYKGSVFWLSSIDTIVFLPEKEYFERRRNYIEFYQRQEDWSKISPEAQENKIKWSMSFGAKDLQEHLDLSKMIIENVYQSNAVTCWKISNYPPSLDYQDIDVKKLLSARGETLEDLKRPQERDHWISDFAEGIKKKLRKELVGTEEDIEPKQKKRRRWF
jgi:hypothetical protein